MTARPKSPARARAAVVSLAALPSRDLFAVGRYAPSRRSFATGVALVALALSAYVFALLTPAFAVERIEVRGAPLSVARDVQRALAPLAGESLLHLDGEGVEQRVVAVPWVAGATYDRAFPHTLVVFVVPERAIAVLRRGAELWLVSARGRVLTRLSRRARPDLPRIWVERAIAVAVGAAISDPSAERALAALRALADEPLPVRVRTVRSPARDLTFLLAGGVELKLGDTSNLRLKLAIARAILSTPGAVSRGPAYVDVTVPERPVTGRKVQLESRG